MINEIHQYNVLNTPWPLADESVDCCITSPPYWGLRDYGIAGQLGLEKTPEEYVDRMVSVFDEVKRVLRPEGTLWLNLGDSYNGSGKGGNTEHSKWKDFVGNIYREKAAMPKTKKTYVVGLKPKDLVGIPWLVAFALRSAGWYLRSDIIWAKPNCMPESVTDRPTRSHEYIFLLSKSAKYYYDHEAIKEPALYDVDGTGTAAKKARQKESNKSMPTGRVAGIRPAGFKDAEEMNGKHGDKQRGHSRRHNGFNDRWDKMTREEQCTGMRNKRDVWTVSTAQFPDAHFATFPEQLITPCVLAGCPKDGIVLDPFMGAGTTALVAKSHGRKYIGFELNPEYIRIAENRLKKEFGMFHKTA
jgi:DNA modification methylase